MKIITFSNNKGGVLKTTLCANLSRFYSVNKSSKVLVVDTDQQGNLAVQFGRHPNQVKNTLSTYANKNAKLKHCVIGINPKLDLLFCNIDWGLMANTNKKATINKLINEASKNYDYLLIDTSPAINDFVIFVLEQANLIVIPSTPEKQAVLGMELILEALPDLKLQKNVRVVNV